VDRVARTANVSQRVASSVDERLQDAISNWVAELFGAGRMAHREYMHTLARVVLTAGHHGRGLIVGRCAHLLLDPAWTLSVRVVAPEDVRIARVAAHRGVPLAEAEARVREVDGARDAFCRRGFGRGLDEPGQYDLVLDTGRLPVETCARIVELAFRGRFPDAAAG
jgi:cytidylate kinase